MSIQVELADAQESSEDRGGTSTTQNYLVISSETITLDEARGAFIGAINPLSLRDKYGNKTSGFTIAHRSRAMGKVWDVSLEFASEDNSNNNPLGLETSHWCDSFDTTGGTTKLLQGYTEERKVLQQGAYAPNFLGGIGWNGESFDGVDVVCPALNIVIKDRYKYQAFLDGAITVVADLTGTVNKGWFLGFSQGNLLFTGAQGTISFENEGETRVVNGELKEVQTPYWDVTFNFRAQPTRKLEWPDGSSVTKEGWDYLWVLHDTVTSEGDETVIKIPRAVYVNQVYPRKDFSAFGFWSYY